MAGKIEIDPLITSHLKLEDINKGFEMMREGKGIRSRCLLGRFLDPQTAPTLAGDSAINKLARSGRDEMVAIIAILAVLRRRLIVDGGLGHLHARSGAIDHYRQ